CPGEFPRYGCVCVVAGLANRLSYSLRLAPSIRSHLVRNAAHDGFCIRLLVYATRSLDALPDDYRPAAGDALQQRSHARERVALARFDRHQEVIALHAETVLAREIHALR